MGATRSGYYDWVGRPESTRAQRHRALTEKIRYFHQVSRETYGSPRICEDLQEAGERVGENTVALLMQRAGIVPKTVRKFRVTTDSRKTVPAPNRLEQQFTVAQPNERWVSDITFIPTRERVSPACADHPRHAAPLTLHIPLIILGDHHLET
jgi:putative transposase